MALSSSLSSSTTTVLSTGSAGSAGSRLPPEVALVTPTTELEREARIAAALGSIATIAFDDGLVGRASEEAVLLKSLRWVAGEDGGKDRDGIEQRVRKEIVFLGGPSGSGKTTLARTLEAPARALGGGFGSGKHNPEQRDRPYSAIAAACEGLLGGILREHHKHNDDRVAGIAKELSECIDRPQLDLLQHLMPSLADILWLTWQSGDQDNAWCNHNDIKNGKGTTLPAVPEQAVPRASDRSSVVSYRKESSHSLRWRSWRSSTMLDNTKTTTGPTTARSSRKEVFERAFCRLVRILSKGKKPLVLLLDDLQWMDAASLGLLKAIAGDDSVSGLLLLGCFRTDEVGVDLAEAMGDLRREAAGGDDPPPDHHGLFVREIRVDNLSVEQVHELVTDVVRAPDPDKTLGLAAIVHKRTLGNVFFVRLFLKQLEEKGLLRFQVGTLRWAWDEDEIADRTGATDNLLSLIKHRMERLSKKVLFLLRIASCLGNTFDAYELGILWEQLVDQLQEGVVSSLREHLGVACDELLFEFVRHTGSYRFVHDKIREAAVLLCPPDEYRSLRSSVGACLYRHLGPEELEDRLFIVVDLLNQGRCSDGSGVCGAEIAGLNLQAAGKAVSFAAFRSATQYLAHGIRILEQHATNAWEEHFRLCLELHTLAAEVEECLGNPEGVDAHARIVLGQPRAGALDKIRVNKLMIERLSTHCRFEELWRACLETFEELGIRFPRNRLSKRLRAATCLRETRTRYLLDSEEVKTMSFVTDPEKYNLFLFLVKAGSWALPAGEKDMYVLIWCHCMRWTKKHGLTEHTPSAFVSFSNILLHREGDLEGSRKMVELAELAQARIESNYTKASTLLKTSQIVVGWVSPLKRVIPRLLEAYRLGTLSGNTDAAAYSVYYAMVSEYFSGTPLHIVHRDMEQYIKELKRINSWLIICLLSFLWQTVLNLIDDPSNPHTTELQGTAMDSMEIKTIPANAYDLNHGMCVCFLCAYFGDYARGAEAALRGVGGFYKLYSGAGNFGWDTFYRGICLYAAAHASARSDRRVYLAGAKRVRKELRAFVKQGFVNFVHQLMLLDAEQAVLDHGSVARAREPFERAIAATVRRGFLHEAGLAHERYALHLLATDQEDSDGIYHMKEAAQRYREWGAFRKTRLLAESYEFL